MCCVCGLCVCPALVSHIAPSAAPHALLVRCSSVRAATAGRIDGRADRRRRPAHSGAAHCVPTNSPIGKEVRQRKSQWQREKEKFTGERIDGLLFSRGAIAAAALSAHPLCIAQSRRLREAAAERGERGGERKGERNVTPPVIPPADLSPLRCRYPHWKCFNGDETLHTSVV